MMKSGVLFNCNQRQVTVLCLLVLFLLFCLCREPVGRADVVQIGHAGFMIALTAVSVEYKLLKPD